MELLVFGHAGTPVLVFPTSNGRFFEYEDYGMVHALEHEINQGAIQLFCVDSIDAETWYNYEWTPGGRMYRHDQYEYYLLTEVLPLIRHLNPTQSLIATGCSLGAFHSMLFTLRYPGVVNRVIALSGLYDIRNFFSGYYGDEVYFHNPVDFVPGISDERARALLSQTDIIMAVGQDDPHRWSNQLLSNQLWSIGVGNALRIWDGWGHDWPYWKQMINAYIGGHD